MKLDTKKVAAELNAIADEHFGEFGVSTLDDADAIAAAVIIWLESKLT